MLHHKKCYSKFWYILLPPEYIANGELRASINISFFSSTIVGTHSRPWHKNRPLDDLEKLPVGFGVSWSKILVNIGSLKRKQVNQYKSQEVYKPPCGSIFACLGCV